jgi:hypothetical protein
MGRRLAALFLLTFSLGAFGLSPEAEKPLSEKDRKDLINSLVGLSPPDVQKKLGRPPKHVARQILYHRYLEQWVYDSPYFIRIEIECQRGQKPHILTVHALTNDKP